MSSSIELNGIEVEVGNQDKIYFPKAKISKGDLIDYYQRIAPYMLPYIKDRLLTMQRFPNGIDEEGFFQKNASDYFPDWIQTKQVEKQEDGVVNYVIANNAATLVYLANQGTITLHTMLSKVDKLDYPDKMIFDFDPSGKATYKHVVWAAKKIKMILERLGLVSFVMTTGSRGLHVVVPLKRELTFDDVRAFAQQVAEYMVVQFPTKCTLEMRKSNRGDRIFIDTLRNAFGQTGVAPYSVRAKEGAPIATPVSWDELLKEHIESQHFTIKNIFSYLAEVKDPWKDFFTSAQSLKQAKKELDNFAIVEHLDEE